MNPMRTTGWVVLFMLVVSLFALDANRLWAADQDTTLKSAVQSPEAVFPDTRYEFDPVMEGTKITHDFIIENHGTAPLIIRSVRPD